MLNMLNIILGLLLCGWVLILSDKLDKEKKIKDIIAEQRDEYYEWYTFHRDKLELMKFESDLWKKLFLNTINESEDKKKALKAYEAKKRINRRKK